MAIYHLTTRGGLAHQGRALSHAKYISREGKYSDRNDIVYRETGNMPAWAQENPTDFWQACDKLERSNGRAYREFEVALPREINHEQHRALVRQFVSEQLGDKHAYEWAIHDKGDGNPHAHIMFSERILDGIDRDREQFFKRANGKNPERGGCRKDARWNVGRGQKSEVLQEARGRWADLQNVHLERAGSLDRVDHRSLEAQGIDRRPQVHVGFCHEDRPEVRTERQQRNEDLKRANQELQAQEHLAANQVDLEAAGLELAKITNAIREIEAREIKARQMEEVAARSRAQALQKPQNAPGANLEPRIREKVPEVQKGENRSSVTPARPAQEKAGATRVWFAFFDSETWEFRAGSQRILSREQNSLEVQARISLEMPPKCVLSEDGRIWSGVFRDGIEAASYGREQGLEKRKAELGRKKKEYIEKKNQEKLIQDQENELLKKFRSEIYSYDSAVSKEKMVVEKINEMDSKINTLIKESKEHSENIRHIKWHERLNPFKIERINNNAKRLDQEHTACLEARKNIETELDEIRKVKDIFWRREAPERKLAEAEKERQRQERAHKFKQEKAKLEQDLERRRQRERELGQDKGQGLGD